MRFRCSPGRKLILSYLIPRRNYARVFVLPPILVAWTSAPFEPPAGGASLVDPLCPDYRVGIYKFLPVIHMNVRPTPVLCWPSISVVFLCDAKLAKFRSCLGGDLYHGIASTGSTELLKQM